ncbi:hypothetical protein [Streptomyces sp.]|uniref:hypothetical protein n=1 Tax=Streptomyces sp. TaxID=1931 RepID=UPI002F91FD32
MTEDEAIERLRELATERRAYGMAASDRCIQAGLDALLAGVDSPSLAQLAGLTRREEPEASDLFESVLDELGLRDGLPTTQAEAEWALVRRILTRIVDGTLDPVAGADRVWDLARPGSSFETAVRPIVHGFSLAYGIDAQDEPARVEAAGEEIRTAARALMELPRPPAA